VLVPVRAWGFKSPSAHEMRTAPDRHDPGLFCVDDPSPAGVA
jgi:hypothetical protein